MADWIINNGRTIELVIMLIVIAFSFGLYLGTTMKCEDCKYYKPINEHEGKCKSDTDRYYGFDTTVVGDTKRECPSFKPKENSWESVSK